MSSRKRQPVPRNADTGDTARSRPAPQPAPITRPVFAHPAGEAPFSQQQQKAQRQTRTATQRLPKPVIAAPPIIQNPTPTQVKAAHAQIVASVRRQLGNSTGPERVARTQALYDQIVNDPRLAQVKASVEHWQNEAAKLTRPQPVARAIPGPPDRHVRVGVGPLHLATLNLTATGQAGARAVEKVAPGLSIPDASGRFVGNAFKDVGTIAQAPFVGALQTYGVAKDVLTGHPVRAGQRVEALGKGLVQGTIHDWSHPGRYIVQHPVLAALDLSGAESIVGRTAGALARARGIEAASTVRPPLALGDDLAAGIVERRGSKDILRRAAQRHADNQLEPLRDAQGNVVTVDQAGRQVPVLKPSTGFVRSGIRHPKVGAQGALNNRRADVLASRANSQERLDREQEAVDRNVKGVRGKAAKAIVSLVTRGAITSAAHFQNDLTKYAAGLRAKLAQHDAAVAKGGDYRGPYLHEGEVEKARENLALAEKVLANPKAMAQGPRIVAEGIRHGAALVEHDTAAAAAGLFEGGAEQARRARLVETAVHHMDAFHGQDPRLTARIKAAKSLEKSLQARLNFHATTAAEKKRLQAQIDASRQMREQITARNTERLRDRHGNPLEPDQIEAFLRSRGRDPNTVAYLPPNVTRQHFHKQFRPGAGRGTLDKPGHIRTGAQALKGAVENSADLLKAAGIRHVTALNKARAIDRLIQEHGMRHPAVAKAASGATLTKHERRVVARGGLFTGQEAAEAISRAAARGEHLVAVRSHPGRLDEATRKMIREDLQGPAAADTLGQRLLNDRFLTEKELKDGGTRNVVLVNGHLVDRLGAHLKPSTSLGKFSQVLNRAFRYAVLPQLKWVLGNFVEPLLLRMPGAGSGVNVFGLGADLIAATKQIRHMERSGDPRMRAAAAEIRAHQFGGLLFGQRGLTNRRTLEDWPHLDAKTKQVYAKMVQAMPATKQLAQVSGLLAKGGFKALKAPLDLIFQANRAGENHLLQRAAFGKSVREEIQAFTGSWAQTIRLGQQAMEEVGKGLINTPTQHRFLDYQHELLGKYEGFSPAMRAIIQGPAPFLPWALNAARFVFWTMPAHRSAQTALLIRLNGVVSKDWQEIHKNAPPGLGLAVPTKDGGWIDFARFTPYGLTAPIAQGDLRGLTSQFLPQASGTEAALEGKDPFGRDLVMSSGLPPTGVDKLKVAGNSLAEAFLPYLSNIRRLQEHGETAFADSTALHPRSKPGTSHGMNALERTFSPVRPTYLNSAGATEQIVSAPPGPSAGSGHVSPRQAVLHLRAGLTHQSDTAARQAVLAARRRLSHR